MRVLELGLAAIVGLFGLLAKWCLFGLAGWILSDVFPSWELGFWKGVMIGMATTCVFGGLAVCGLCVGGALMIARDD